MTSSTSAPSPADEDHRLIKGLVVRTLLLDVLERDIRTLDTLMLKMPEVYILSLTRIQNNVLKEMLVLRKQMRTRGVKVLEEKREAEGIETLYMCRGIGNGSICCGHSHAMKSKRTQSASADGLGADLIQL